MTTAATYSAEQISLEIAAAGLLNHLDRLNGWIERGDGIAVYENVELGHPQCGHRQYVSFGGPEAQLEDVPFGQAPPERLPDIGNAINWRYRLVGYYRADAPLAVPESWKGE